MDYACPRGGGLGRREGAAGRLLQRGVPGLGVGVPFGEVILVRAAEGKYNMLILLIFGC